MWLDRECRLLAGCWDLVQVGLAAVCDQLMQLELMAFVAGWVVATATGNAQPWQLHLL